MGKINFVHEYTVEGYITFSIKIISGEFSGTSSFCLSKSTLLNAILALGEMYNQLEGAYQINNYDNDDFILFEFAKHGHLNISGQVGGSHNQQFLVYNFMTDQTALHEVISTFHKVVSFL